MNACSRRPSPSLMDWQMPEIDPTAARNFANRVIAWQQAYGRHDLPWQQTRDAYHVWLSEIMLQQTRVASVIPYYHRFLERFPTLEALAAANLDSVLESWSGLGYYARARNLHRCAQIIIAEHAGKFPIDGNDDLRLPGIGRSTAAAISVFAFGRRAAILDGNVKRVLARCFGVDGSISPAQVERSLWTIATALLPESRLEAYTQGMMDLGATVCHRRQPTCALCPLAAVCVARRDGRQAELPRGKAKKALRERSSNVLLLDDGQRVLLERRPPTGLWGGLLTLPERSGESPESFAQRQGCRLLGTQALPPVRHAFTHFRVTIHALRCDVASSSCPVGESGWEWLPRERVASAALPTPIRKLLLSAQRLR